MSSSSPRRARWATVTQHFVLTVDAVPILRTKSTLSATVGIPLNVVVATSHGFPVPGVSTTSALPPGLALAKVGAGTAALVGTPVGGTAGTYPISIVATNGVGPPVIATLSVMVFQAPSITAVPAVTLTAGVPMAPLTISVVGAPAPEPAGIGSAQRAQLRRLGERDRCRERYAGDDERRRLHRGPSGPEPSRDCHGDPVDDRPGLDRKGPGESSRAGPSRHDDFPGGRLGGEVFPTVGCGVSGNVPVLRETSWANPRNWRAGQMQRLVVGETGERFVGTTYALVGGAVPLGQTKANARHWQGFGQVALAAMLAVGFLSLLRVPAPTLGTPAQPAAPSVHGPGALSFRVGPSGDLAVTAGSSDALRVVPAGFGRGAIRPLESSAKAAAGVAATYDHGALSVWYSHRGDALDQGFTVARRLAGGANKVVIAMNTSGALHPELESPTSLSFEGSKLPPITYSSLKVTDAAGRVLPARLGLSGTSVRIMFNDRKAVYPVRVDPLIQQSFLTPPAGSAAFGWALATSSSGTTVLVGDPYANLATVYTFSGGSWSSGVALTPPAGSVSFGTSVALSSNGAVALVGDPSGGAGGTATVYTLTSGVWSSGVALTAPAEAGAFGTSVALSGAGTTALVGDPFGGDDGTGAATVYTDTTSWNAGTDLVVPSSPIPAEFGMSVALSNSGSIALVGDPTAGSEARGLVTSFSGASWATTAVITPSAAGTGGFGSSVAVSGAGTTAVVGDPTYPTSAGSAGIYTGSETASAITSWAKTSTLTAPSGSVAFGTAVAITAAGTEALVGDPMGGAGAGAASSYSTPSGTWSATTAATALTPPPFTENFGTAVAVSGDASSAFVGDPSGTGANPALEGTVSAYSANGRFWNLGTVAVPPPDASSFGTAVSISSTGTTVLEGDLTADTAGAASVYTYNGSTLSTPSALTRPAGASSFGTSVAVSGNGSTAVVGDPDSFNLTTDTGGSATVYTLTGSTWSSGITLPVPSTAFDFGNSVAISASGNEILVGDPEGGDNGTGAVTEFTLSGGTWSTGTALSTPVNTVTFGTTVALSANGNVALVADPGAPDGGSVIPYTLDSGIFSEGNPLPTPAHASAFGTALALSQTGNVALVGDPTGGSSGTGAATVFTGNAGSWAHNASLTPVGTPAQFGASVALSASGESALVGDPGAQTYGTATLYDFDGSWSAGSPLTVTPNAETFGSAVALSADGTTAAVGDPNGGTSGGEVTVFSLDATTAATSVSASANPSSASGGTPVTYSATVSTGSGTPTGTVRFSTGLITLVHGDPLRGKGELCPRATPRPGVGAVFASYSGDSHYTPSTRQHAGLDHLASPRPCLGHPDVGDRGCDRDLQRPPWRLQRGPVRRRVP